MKAQIRFEYQQVTPLIAQPGGGTTAGSPVWRVIKRSECQSSLPSNPASCVGTPEETVTEFAYNSRNVTVASITRKLGDGTLLDKKYFTYGYFGEVLSVAANPADTSSTGFMKYDVDGRLIFEFTPDPDGPGPLPRLVVKHVYDGDGREVERLNGRGNLVDGSDFVWQEKVRNTFDVATSQIAKREVVTP